MGTDNLFHKRKARTAATLQRRVDKRDPYAKVLIVCEGEKTEPHYFNELRNHYGLNTANVEVCGDCGSAPNNVLAYAKQRYREELGAGDAFDKVFCVFDKDAHPSYTNVLTAIAAAKPARIFEAINSVPCFEYWLLLHFNYSTKPYQPLPGRSTGDQVLSDLCGYMAHYKKGAGDVFLKLISQLEFAKQNSARALREAERSDTDNPSTRVHELVNYLQEINKPNGS
ncbi:MAG: RloB family protein [Pseudohongiellaceae bacterium]